VSASGLLPATILVTPWLTGVLTLFVPEARARERNVLNLGAALLKSILVVVLLAEVYRGTSFELRYPVLPGVDLVLAADAWSLLFLGLSTLLWLLTTIYAIGYLAHSHHRSRFFAFFSMCVGCTAGIALAGNLLTFLVFYELLTLATYPLVVHKGNVESLRAGRRYLAYTLVGGTLFLAGVVWLRAVAGPVDFGATGVLAGQGGIDPATLRAIFLLLIVGLGVKAALVPLHGWLPVAMVAPAPVSALLHAVAVVKAGAFGIARVVYDVFGVEFAARLGVTTPLAVLAATSIVYGSVRALSQDGLKRRLAYSTVSQVAYIALGTAIAGPVATVGGIIHLVHQGLMKITLFFCAGNLAEVLDVHRVSQVDGAGRSMPWTMGAFTVAALGMIGVPPVAGFVSKWYLGLGAAEAGSGWVIAVMVASSLLNAAYFLPIVYRAWFRSPTREPVPPARAGPEAPWTLLAPPLVTAGLALVVGVLAKSPYSPLGWARLIVAREYGIEPLAELSFTHLDWSLVATFGIPLLCAACAWAERLRPLAVRLLPWAALPALALALLPGGTPQATLPWLFLGTVLKLDATARIFLLFTSLLWTTAGIFSIGYLRDDPARGRFAGFFLLAMAGNLGLVVAADVVSFIVFFTLMSFASYGLIVHTGTADARRAGRVYITLVVVGEVCLYAALVATLHIAATGTPWPWPGGGYGGWAVALLLVGFGIKAGLLPLHVWLPLAHPVAPAPASAVLSGAMVAAGVLGWLRFLPLGVPGWEPWGAGLAALGMAGAFYAAIVGTVQTDAKTVLAYSTVSQMGLVIAGVGAALWQPVLAPGLVPAVAVYVLHHGLAKGALFLAAPLLPTVSRSGGRRWWAWIAVGAPALAIAGAPLTSGAVAKALLKTSLDGQALAVLLPLLSLAAVGSTTLMARFVWLARPVRDGHRRTVPTMWLGWLASAALALTVTWQLPAVVPVAGKALGFGASVGQSWPIVVGGILYLLLSRRAPARVWGAVPSGDLLVPLEMMAARAGGAARRLAGALAPRFVAWRRRLREAAGYRPALARFHPAPILAGAGAGLAFMGVLLVLFLALNR